MRAKHAKFICFEKIISRRVWLGQSTQLGDDNQWRHVSYNRSLCIGMRLLDCKHWYFVRKIFKRATPLSAQWNRDKMISYVWVCGRARSGLGNPFLCVRTKWMTPTVHSVYYATRSLCILSIHIFYYKGLLIYVTVCIYRPIKLYLLSYVQWNIEDNDTFHL